MIAFLGNKNGLLPMFRLFNLRFYSKKIEKRNPNFATLNDKDLSFFQNLLTNTRCITDPQLLDTYNSDWLRIVKGE